MISSARIQLLLGFGIVVIGAFIMFDRSKETIVPADIPLPPAGLPIKLVNAKTKECMADMACMQNFFLKGTNTSLQVPMILGSANGKFQFAIGSMAEIGSIRNSWTHCMKALSI